MSGAFFAAFLPDVPCAGDRPAAFRADARVVFPAAGFLADFFAADFFVDFFAADFLPADFFGPDFAGRRAVFFVVAFLAGVRFEGRDAFFAALRAGFLAADFFAGALVFFFAAALRPAVFVVLREDFPAVFFAAVFDVAFFTLFFPDVFLVVLLALCDAFADRGFCLVPAEFLPVTFFAAVFRPFVFVALFPAVAFRPGAFFPACALLDLAAGGRTVATRALGGVVSTSSACPVFDLACGAILTSRNAGMACPAGCVV